ncbi:Glutamyl-tRNA(Gln) amidotransferase subunit A [Yarrowia sp. C11]|nr:Glutamyl-tRNA(Gln) amidotransferase subunit A [Yarrowia sp. C11]KAG5364306.1 Glutamyl-tRNA(Gln) amidotransferase subunit A [Yarrowia sp. E02]
MSARLTVQKCMENIVKSNPYSNALISTAENPAVAQSGALAGIALAVKDNICTDQMYTTCASGILEKFTSPFDATVVELLKKEGVSIVGKANLDEFGMGSDNQNSWFGPVFNPLYPDEPHTPGGSSGGSAAAVAADMCHFALGTDTGGSVRYPAAQCSVIGLKPSYGLISRHGVIAYAQSLDTVGILSKDIDLVEKVFNIVNQYDPLDPTSLTPHKRAKLKPPKPHRKLTFGLVKEYNIKGISDNVKMAWSQIMDELIKMGHEVVTCSIPAIKNALPAYYAIAPAEASSNFARFDGIRYGSRAPEDREDGTLYAPTRQEYFGNEVKRRMWLGTWNLSTDAFNHDYIRSQKIRRILQEDFDEVFNRPNVLSGNEGQKAHDEPGVDFIIAPTSNCAPYPLAKLKDSAPVDTYLNDVLTVPASLTGIPSLNIPWKTEQGNVGMQIMGQYGDDLGVLKVGRLLLDKCKELQQD